MKLNLQKNRLLLSLWCFFAAALCAYAQVTVTGTVTDKAGETMPGVSVRLKSNPQVAAATDIDGQFTLKVPNLQSTLEVTYVGYKAQSVALNGRSKVEIVLQEDSELLDEVVVVGYGQQKKVSVTGSVSAVSGADLVKAPMTNVSNLLTGKVSGITADQSARCQ